MRRASALLVVVLGCSHGPTTAPATATPAPVQGGGATVATLSLPTYANDGTHAFAEDRGHVVVIDAWATWCEPCARSLPLLHTLQQRFAAQGLRTYAVSIDAGRGDIPGFLQRTPITLPILLDRDGEALETVLGLRSMPTTWVIDRSGKVRAQHEGFQGDVAALQADVERILAEPH